MTGLTLDQFKEIVEFAQTYHEFGRYYDDIERAGITTLYPKWKHLHIATIESHYNTGRKEIHAVCFRMKDGGSKIFHEWDGPVFDRVLQYLKGGEE